ncbi:MAG: tetrahydrofolate dehydrogenase/cyclohydrolase catalytic domain-containing protein, partial [Pseudomonadota bacterium]
MSAHLLDGKALAAQLTAQLDIRIQQMLGQIGRPPGLSVIQVGSDPASGVYVGNKQKAALRLGFASHVLHLAEETSSETLSSVINQLNNGALYKFDEMMA